MARTAWGREPTRSVPCHSRSRTAHNARPCCCPAVSSAPTCLTQKLQDAVERVAPNVTASDRTDANDDEGYLPAEDIGTAAGNRTLTPAAPSARAFSFASVAVAGDAIVAQPSGPVRWQTRPPPTRGRVLVLVLAQTARSSQDTHMAHARVRSRSRQHKHTLTHTERTHMHKHTHTCTIGRAH
jgi:hypothetical protein